MEYNKTDPINNTMGPRKIIIGVQKITFWGAKNALYHIQ